MRFKFNTLLRAILAGSGVSTPSYYLNLSSPSNVTIADAQARGTITSTYNAVITASMSPSRTTGVAPLYVNFDMTGTTSTDSTNPTHECFFATDFGDSGAGVWTNGVQSAGLTSKNAGYGPVTGHVYETPGTYYPSMTVLDGDGNLVTKTGTIVVQDPDVVYAGTDTICLSHSGNFIGAPSGSSQPTITGNTDMYSLLNTYKASNKRILFCKADSWTCSDQVSFTSLTGLTIDGYGTGVARAFGSGTLIPVTPDNFGATTKAMFLAGASITDLKICSMKITADESHNVGAGTASSVGLMFSKVEIRGAQGGWNINASQNPTEVIPDQTCLYECVVDELYGEAFYDTPGVTATFDSTTDIFSAPGHIFSINQAVVLRGTVPAGLVTDNAATYYISATSFTANQFRLSLTAGGAAIDLTSTGTCTVGKKDLHGGIGIYTALTRGGLMGCYVDTCNHGEQTVRIPFIDRGHINNNFIARPNQTKNALKIHSVIHAYFPVWSEKFVVSGNYITERGGYGWNGTTINRGYESLVGAGSGGNGGVGGEWVRNGIFENNYLEGSLGAPKDGLIAFGVSFPTMTIRNNIVDFSLGDRSSAVNTGYPYTQIHLASVTTSTADQTIGVYIYNNTLYSNISNAQFGNLVYFGDAVTNPDADTIVIKNNIWYLPHHGAPNKNVYYNQNNATTNITASNNTADPTTSNPNFTVMPPISLADWRPASGSYAIDTGAIVPVLRDFNMATRVGSTYDLGAVLP